MRKSAEGSAHVKPLPPRRARPEDRRSTEVQVEAVDVDTNPHGRPRLLPRSDGTTFLRDRDQCDAALLSQRAPRLRTLCATFPRPARRKDAARGRIEMMHLCLACYRGSVAGESDRPADPLLSAHWSRLRWARALPVRR